MDRTETMLASYKPEKASATPKPTQSLWTLVKHDRRVEAVLLNHGATGCELQMFLNGEFYKGRMFANCALALVEGDRTRGEMLQRGWRGVSDMAVRDDDERHD